MTSQLLEGKKCLITGVLTDSSIAFGVAKQVKEHGGTVILSSFGRAMSLTQRCAKKIGDDIEVIELDVTNDDDLASLSDKLGGSVDCVLHAIAFAPETCLGGDFLEAPFEDVKTAMQVSAYSYGALARAVAPLMKNGGSIVGLDFDATYAWPAYDWMGVCKAALESINRYAARELGPKGIRSNLVAAGPLRTIAAKSIPGFAKFEEIWDERAPLGWDLKDTLPVADTCVALFSELMRSTTGEIIHVDGGFHSQAV
jgi:enoyl ACP reductase